MVNETLLVFCDYLAFLCCRYASTSNSMRPWLSVDQSEPPQHLLFCLIEHPHCGDYYVHIHVFNSFSNAAKQSDCIFKSIMKLCIGLLYLVLNVCLYWHSLCTVPHEIISILSQGSLKWDLIIGTALSQSYPLLLTTKSNDLLSANQYGKPRQLPMCSRQYGPTKTWETLWTRRVGTRATLRYLLPVPG